MTASRLFIASLLAVAGCASVFDIEHVDVPLSDAPLADDAAPEPGLVAYFPLDQLDTGVTRDVVHALEASCPAAECPAPALGKLGFGLDFDGVDDILHVRRIAELETTTGFTVTAWLLQEAPLVTDTFGCPVNKRLGGVSSNTWQLCSNGASLTFITNAGTGAHHFLTAQGGWSIGAWHHIAGSWDGSVKKLYVDGIEQASFESGVAFDGGVVLIGADIDNGAVANQFPGIVDEVRIYSRALDYSEILQLSNQ